MRRRIYCEVTDIEHVLSIIYLVVMSLRLRMVLVFIAKLDPYKVLSEYQQMKLFAAKKEDL